MKNEKRTDPDAINHTTFKEIPLNLITDSNGKIANYLLAQFKSYDSQHKKHNPTVITVPNLISPHSYYRVKLN